MDTVVYIKSPSGDVVHISGEGENSPSWVWLDKGFKGFFDPSVDIVTKPVGNRPGAKFVRYRYTERSITFVVNVFSDGGVDWRKYDARWRDLWSYDQYSQIYVGTETSSGDIHYRHINVRLDDISVDTEYDPHVGQCVSIGMSVVADDPFWYGETSVYDLDRSDGVSSISVESANPGDVEIWPVWVAEAGAWWEIPDYDFRAGDLSKRIRVPELHEGEDVVINTDPGTRQITAANGALVWARMNGVRFRNPVPPRTGKVTFEVKSSAPKALQLRLTPRYTRPWGDAGD